MQQPLVSVGVPTYNRPATLERTLKSIVEQSYKNLEIIVSDNGSSDFEVEKVIQGFTSDPRVTYFRHPVNKGASFNFDFVLERAGGDYFMRLADDDWIDKNFIRNCISFLSANPDYTAACGKTCLYSLSGDFVKYDPPISLDQEDIFKRLSYYYGNVEQNGIYYSLIRKKFKHLVKSDIRLGSDWVAVARLAFEGKLKLIEDTHLNLTMGGVGSSMESIVNTFGLSEFARRFPQLSIALNAFEDIMWNAKVYRKINVLKRLKLAATCFMVIFRRFNVAAEIRGRYRVYLKSVFFGPKPR